MPNKIEKWLVSDVQKQQVIGLINSLTVDPNKPIQIIITDAKIDRTKKQNKYYFGWVLGNTEKMLRDAGITYKGMPWTPELLHEVIADNYLLRDEIVSPNGNIIKRRWSTAELPKKRIDPDDTRPTFGEYVELVKQFCFSTWEIIIPEPRADSSWDDLRRDVI